MYKLKFTLSLLLFAKLYLFRQLATAQQLTEKSNIRIYEHHSSEMTGADFGWSADGTQSGYDFMAHNYISSFDMDAFDMYTAESTVPESIDMVEHNGVFGNGRNFGF